MGRTHLAPNLFLTAHDSFTGKLAVSRELLDCGLVAAELADLIIHRRLDMSGDRVVVAAQRGDGGDDEIGAYVVESVSRQPKSHTVRTWAGSLGETVFGLVAGRLVDDGVVRWEARRGPLRRGPDRYPAVDLLKASGPKVRLQHMISHPADFDLPGAVNASIVGVLGVERILEVDVDKSVFGVINANLPRPLQALMSGLATSVAAVSLTVRR